MAQIVVVVTSIDTLAAYKVSDDLILELVGVTATVDDDSEGASVGTWWVQVVEPHEPGLAQMTKSDKACSLMEWNDDRQSSFREVREILLSAEV